MNTADLQHKAAALYDLLSNACEQRKIRLAAGDISVPLIAEVCYHLHKDLNRIDEHQQGEAAVQNFMGFLVFWVAKLKPIRPVVHKGKSIVDINEQAAVWACHLLFRSLPETRKSQKDVAALKGDKASKTRVLDHTFRFYMSDGRYISLIYTIRHRNITGDALTLYFGALIRAGLFKRSDG